MSDTVAAPEDKAVDAADLRCLLDGEYREIRERVRKRMGDDRFKPVPGDIDRDEYRELVMKWMKMLADDGETTILFPEEYGGQGNVGAAIAGFEMLAPRRPVAARQVRRAVRPVRRRDPPPRHTNSTTSATCAASRAASCPAASR